MTKRQMQFAWDDADTDKGECALWCDEEFVEQIRALGGVASIVPIYQGHSWRVTFDLRYDWVGVMDDIEAVIMEGKDD